MSLLEGHGDVTMDRAGAAAIPERSPLQPRCCATPEAGPGPARLLQQLIGIEAKLRQYEEGERFIAAVEDSGGPSSSTGPGGARSGCPRWRDPRPVGVDRPGRRRPRPARAEPPPRGVAGRPESAACSARCTFPPARGAARCAACRAGADSLALLVLAVAAGCRVTAVHVDHGLRPGSAAEAEVVAAAAARFGAGFRSERVDGGRRAQPRGPGPGGPPGGARPGRGHRPHRRRPGRDGAGQPAAGAGRRRTGRHAGRARATPAGPAPGRDRAPCAGGSGLDPVRRPDQRRPPLRAQPGPPRAAAPVLGHRRPRRRARPGPPGRRCWPATPTSSTAWPRSVDPADAAAAGRGARRPWPGGPCGAG